MGIFDDILPKQSRGFWASLGDNLLGFDDEYDTPGERLGRGINDTAKALWNDPMGVAKSVKGDMDNLMFQGGAMQRPQDVLGYAAAPMAPGAAVGIPAGAVGAGALRFNTRMRDYHHGQSDRTLELADDDGPMGRIDYSEYEGEPAIQMIEVEPDRRREGAATNLLAELQKAYPDKEIDWGSLTDDGAKLYEKTPFSEVPSPAASKFALIDKLDEQMAQLEVKIKQNWGTPDAEAAMRRFYELEDRKRRLVDFLDGEKRSLKLIETYPPRL